MMGGAMTKADEEARTDGWQALLRDARRLVEEIADSDLVELEIEVAGTRFRLRQTPGPAAPTLDVAPEAAREERLTPIASPLNGVFYSRPSPTSEPYVRVGDAVEIGQVVCLVEAMKSFNEIHSEVAGHVRQVLVENAQVVNAGDSLMLIEPLQGDAGEVVDRPPEV
jgi:biotin carboxyl carrier protein